MKEYTNDQGHSQKGEPMMHIGQSMVTGVLTFWIMLSIASPQNNKEDVLIGTITSINSKTATIVVSNAIMHSDGLDLQIGKSIKWQVSYEAGTEFTYMNKAASVAAVREGRRIRATGTSATKDLRMTATRIEVRD